MIESWRLIRHKLRTGLECHVRGTLQLKLRITLGCNVRRTLERDVGSSVKITVT